MRASAKHDHKGEKHARDGGGARSVPTTAESVGGFDWRPLLLALGVFVAVLLVFGHLVGNGFVDWDDPDTLLNNPHYRGFGGDQLRWMFTTFYWGHYQPLLWLSYAWDYTWTRALFGDGLTAGGYHATSVLLHAVNVLLLCVLVLRVAAIACAHEPSAARQPAWWTALLAALLFGLHPLRAEPVAWATGRGDVLVTTFMLLTVLAYLRGARAERAGAHALWLAAAAIAYALSVLTRGMGVTLPIVLLVLDWYPLRRLGGGHGRWLGRGVRGVWLEKIPFVTLAAVGAALAPLAKARAGSTMDLALHGPLARIVQSCYGLVFYVWKTVVPIGLSPIYELRLPIDVTAPRYVVAVLVVLAAVVMLWLLRRRQPAVVAAVLCYALLAAPILGLVQSGNQEAADRYSYLPAIPLTLLAAFGLRRAWLAERMPGRGRTILGGVSAAVIVFLAALSWRQGTVWHDTGSLWQHAAAVCPESSIARNGYGWVLLQAQRYDAAIEQLRTAIAIQPTNEKAHHNLWIALREQGRADDLIAAYRDATHVHPQFVDAHYNLGNQLLRRGELDAALESYETALRLRPNHSGAHAGVANVYYQRGDWQTALQAYEQAVRSDGRNTYARRGLAQTLRKLGRTSEAVAQLRAILQIDSNDERARGWLREWEKSAPGGP